MIAIFCRFAFVCIFVESRLRKVWQQFITWESVAAFYYLKDVGNCSLSILVCYLKTYLLLILIFKKWSVICISKITFYILHKCIFLFNYRKFGVYNKIFGMPITVSFQKLRFLKKKKCHFQCLLIFLGVLYNGMSFSWPMSSTVAHLRFKRRVYNGRIATYIKQIYYNCNFWIIIHYHMK